MAKTGSAAEAASANKPKVQKKAKPKKLGKAEQKWMDNYERLKKFKEDHGHTYVSLADEHFHPGPFQRSGNSWFESTRGRTPKDRYYHAFAKWVSRQRAEKMSGKLRADREKLLTDIDFYFNTKDYFWDIKFNEICEIKKKVGHVDIPNHKDALTDENKVYAEFMEWADEQKTQYFLHIKGWHSRITDRRIKKLNEIGFAWFPDEDDKKRREAKAQTQNLAWITRKIKYDAHGVLKAIGDAQKEHDQTGDPAIARYGGDIIGKEKDGTMLLLSESWLDEEGLKCLEEKGIGIICITS